MSARTLRAWVFAFVVAIVVIVGGAILLSLDKAADAGDSAKTNQGDITQARSRLATNERKDDMTRRCLTVSKRPQACIEDVAGAQGPGGAVGATGATGRRGLSVTGARGPTGDRGPSGAPSQISGPQGKDGPMGPPGATGAPGPAGEQGPKGDTGATGRDGSPAPVPPEAVPVPGPMGPAGMDGQPGSPGADGQPGAPGTLVLSVETCALPGLTATDPDGDGTFTCPGTPP
jgi:hypothetical protein